MSVLLTATLVGCSTTYREIEAFQTGWRTAEVLEIGLAAEIQRSGLTDCRESATAQELATRRFAVVSYRVSGRPHRHVVTMDEASGIHPGDRVFINVLRCGAQMELRPPAGVRGK